MQNTEPTLESVTNAFNEWRANKKGARSHTPETLKHQALVLLKHHRISHVIDALRLNSSTLKAWKLKQDGHQNSAQFIPLPTAESSVNEPGNNGRPLQITLRTTSGAEILVSGDLSPAQLTALVKGMHHNQEDF